MLSAADNMERATSVGGGPHLPHFVGEEGKERGWLAESGDADSRAAAGRPYLRGFNGCGGVV